MQEIEKHTWALELQRLQVERFEEDKRGLLQAIGESPTLITGLSCLCRYPEVCSSNERATRSLEEHLFNPKDSGGATLGEGPLIK